MIDWILFNKYYTNNFLNHCEFIIIPNHEHEFMYEKWAPNFFKLKILLYELIFVQNIFIQHPSKMKMELL